MSSILCMHILMLHSQECPEFDLASKYKEMLPDEYPSSFYLKCISSCFAENMSKVLILLIVPGQFVRRTRKGLGLWGKRIF